LRATCVNPALSMRRDLARLGAEPHDVIVVGGGIHGACVAWEAARRGLRVALIEAGDFNRATSANSLRTLHGGLRHLQRLDFVHMRESIRERSEWLRMAPELTQPMRFVLPTHGAGTRSRAILRTALWVNDIVSADRNQGIARDHQLPQGAILDKAEFDSRYPGLSIPAYDGAAAWYDGICLNTERLQLAVVMAAVACGAQAANYLRALHLLQDGTGVTGVRVRDELTARQMDLHARVIINAAGPWIEEWLRAESSEPGQAPRAFKASKAFNLLVRKLPFGDALGLTARGNTYFVMPWNGYSLVGTRHLRCDPATREPSVSREEVLAFLADLNPLLGEHRLSGADIHGVFSGLLPEADGAAGPDVALERSAQIIDHTEQGLAGVVSIIGVKWTTARAVGERVARRACRRLGRTDQLSSAERKLDCNTVLPPPADPLLAARIVPDLPVVLGQVVHAVREEMAMRLSDAVRRRTPLYLSTALDRSVLASCAATMARELRWSRRDVAAEIEATEAEIAAFRGPFRADARPVAA
jgi:glycerol-3-phosphate dehydrogenase